MPAEIGFAAKPRLARQILERAFAAGVPAAWVTADEIYGDATELRQWLVAHDHPYVLAVSCAHPIWRDGVQVRAERVIATLPPQAWATGSAGAGSQGERCFDWAWIRLPVGDDPATAHWLLARRSRRDPTEFAYYRACGPAAAPVAELILVAGLRWAIDVGFEEAKGVVGLDHYEVRKWTPWHRHITLALLAHAYLAVARRHKRRRPKRGAADLIPLTVPEVRRLLWVLTDSPERRTHRLAWSVFRRHHQAVAKRGHTARRARAHQSTADPPVQILAAALPDLTDARWTRIASLLAPERGAGRPARDHRTVRTGILWVIRTGSSWRDLPEDLGPWQTVNRRFRRWRDDGAWTRILEIVRQPEH